MVSLGISAAVGLATLLSRPIFRLVDVTRAIAAGDFNVSLPITSHDELGTLTQAFNQMVKSLREKEMIKRAFSRYVAREVVEEVLKDPEQLQLEGSGARSPCSSATCAASPPCRSGSLPSRWSLCSTTTTHS
jgi:HAMP domain-containing protein